MRGTRQALLELDEQGYTLIPEFLGPTRLAAVRAAAERELGHYRGRNDFEGELTERVYACAARDAALADVAQDARMLEICEAILQPGFLLTGSQAINIHPGETPQPFHADDSFYPLPRPRKMVSIGIIVAIDAFTADNGATEVIPGSHRWSDDEVRGIYSLGGNAPAEAREARLAAAAVPAILPAGGAIVFAGTLIHRGGANRSAAPRLAITNQYCEPWARTQENFFLSVPPEVVRQLPPRVQALLGYDVYPPFMGHVMGRHPLKTLAPDYEWRLTRRS